MPRISFSISGSNASLSISIFLATASICSRSCSSVYNSPVSGFIGTRGSLIIAISLPLSPPNSAATSKSNCSSNIFCNASANSGLSESIFSEASCCFASCKRISIVLNSKGIDRRISSAEDSLLWTTGKLAAA